MKRKLLFIILLLATFPYSIYGRIIERVYLQTDKQLYISGEPILLKIYTTGIEGKLQEFSKIGYVELLSDTEAEVRIKLEIKNGIGIGQMELPLMLGTGNYKLSAYTRYMRNEGEYVFFEKMITVINPSFLRENAVEAEQPQTTLVGAISQPSTVQLTVNKNRLGKREKGIITIAGLPEEYASLAVSIAGEPPFFYGGKSITDWKNNLRQPTESFARESFLPEYEGAIISGQLVDNETSTPVFMQNASVLLTFPGKEIQIYSGQSERDGIYNFYTKDIAGKKELTTTVFPDFENTCRLDLLSPFSSHSFESLPPLYLDSMWKECLSMQNLSLQVMRAYIGDSTIRIHPQSPHNVLTPFRQYILNEYTRFQRIEEIFIEFIMEARIRKINDKRVFSVLSDAKKGFSSDYILVLLDNIPVIDHDLICNYNAMLLERIDIYQGRHIFGGQLYGGIIHFITNKGDHPNIRFESYTQLFDFEGAQPYRYFYSPDYEKRDNSTRMPDFRHTLLWEPLIDSKDGKSITVPFYTSDIPGKYDVRVEGISRDGKIINAVLQIEVAE